MKAIDKALPSRRWLIALDRDGTLVPIAARPEEARVGTYLHTLIQRLSNLSGVEVAIVSARSCAQLRGDFDSRHAIIAGNYGMEVLFPDGRLAIQPQALQAVPFLKMVRDELASRIDLNDGAILEDHGYSLCLHWHQVPAAKREEVHKAVSTVAGDFPLVHFRTLETSYEAVPNIAWDKGAALSFIKSNLPGAGDNYFYFYAGDTRSDAPAFDWVVRHRGISVRIGGSENLGAGFRLDSPEQLLEALSYIIMRRGQLSAA